MLGEIIRILENSSMSFAMVICEARGFILDASKIHAKGEFYTTQGSVHKWEINNGEATGCTIVGFALVFNISPALKPGRVYVKYEVYDIIVGNYSIANTTPVNIVIEPSGTQINNQQGPVCIYLQLMSTIMDAGILAISGIVNNAAVIPGSVNSSFSINKIVEDYMDEYVQSQEFKDMISEKSQIQTQVPENQDTEESFLLTDNNN